MGSNRLRNNAVKAERVICTICKKELSVGWMKYGNHTCKPDKKMSEDKLRLLPEEVPDYLFTRNELKMMGLVPTAGMSAFVLYPEQKKEYQLYDVAATRSPKKQSGFSLVRKDYTVEEVLARRRHAIKVRKSQFGNIDLT